MSSSIVCVDASFVARLFMGPDEDRAWELFDSWVDQGTVIHAPTLLAYELTNVLHRYHRAGYLSAVSTELVLDAIASLPLTLDSHHSLDRSALRIAADADLPATYDAYYLALAKRYDAHLWTADRRLAAGAGEYKSRVQLLGESATIPDALDGRVHKEPSRRAIRRGGRAG